MTSKLRKILTLGLLLGSLFGSGLGLIYAQGGSGDAGFSGITQPGFSGSTQQPAPSPSAPSVSPGSKSLENPFAFETIPQFLEKILDIIIKVGGVLAFFFIIYAGFLFVTSAGDETKVKAAKMTFLWTIIGVAIVLGAKVIATLLAGTVTNVIN